MPPQRPNRKSGQFIIAAWQIDVTSKVHAIGYLSEGICGHGSILKKEKLTVF